MILPSFRSVTFNQVRQPGGSGWCRPPSVGESRSIPEAAEGILPAGRKAKTRVLLLVIVDVVREQPFQMTFLERDGCDPAGPGRSFPRSAPRCLSALGFRRRSEPGGSLRSEQRPGSATHT